MYLTIILAPLLASAITGLLGRKLGVTGSYWITCGTLILTTLLSWITFYEIALSNSPVIINLANWINTEEIDIAWNFNFDSLTVSMFLAVLIVSSLVHIYSIEYMGNDPHQQRFFSYLSLFTGLMIILITADNYLLMFIGWEGVGISSFLLVGFWYTRTQANTSAMSAILYNRVGDMFLTIGLFSILFLIRSIDFSITFSLAPYLNQEFITLIGLLLLLGAMAKSAQLGLHVWLPSAMEGPTPVSALIHAATMVTAGVYLLMRSSPLIEYSNTILLIILWVGAMTALFAGCCGLFMNDIKRIIAYSTMSQLGYMTVALSLSNYSLALFHLINHAFFKASLFMSAGQVLHGANDNQNLMKYGGLSKILPLSLQVIFVASLALVAFPYTAGFYSKELIISLSRGNYLLNQNIIYWIITLTALLTLLYSIKLIYYTFLSPVHFHSIKQIENSHESGYFMSIPLVILGIASLFSGYWLSDLFIGLGSDFLNEALFTHPNHLNIVETEFGVSSFYKLLPLILTLLGIIVYFSLLEIYPTSVSYYFNILYYPTFIITIIRLINQKFWYDSIINYYIIDSSLYIGFVLNKHLDRGALESLGPTGITSWIYSIGNQSSLLDNSSIVNYSLYMVTGLSLFLLLNYNLISIHIIVLLILALLSSSVTQNRI
jgi:NADH-ubiquinone oxidoreductase chain 5